VGVAWGVGDAETVGDAVGNVAAAVVREVGVVEIVGVRLSVGVGNLAMHNVGTEGLWHVL